MKWIDKDDWDMINQFNKARVDYYKSLTIEMINDALCIMCINNNKNSDMDFKKTDGVYIFNDYRSFFKFINNYEGDLVVKKYEVYSEGKLIARYNHEKN